MDLATVLVRVNRRAYTTTEGYITDIARIPAAMQQYITPEMQREDVEALRAVSAASALVDAAQALVGDWLGPGDGFLLWWECCVVVVGVLVCGRRCMWEALHVVTMLLK